MTKVSSVDLLITVPNRVVYLLREDKIKLNKIEWLVVDESDKLFEIGERGFRDQLASIYRACSSGKARRALFSATFANDVEEWCKTNFDNVVSVTVGERNTATKAVDQELLYTGKESIIYSILERTSPIQNDLLNHRNGKGQAPRVSTVGNGRKTGAPCLSFCTD